MSTEHTEYDEENWEFATSLRQMVISDETIQQAHQRFREGKTEYVASPELP